MIRTVFKKQWLDMQGRLWTYPLVAFCFAVLSDGGQRAFTNMAIVAFFLVLDLVNQTAGDDARHGTFEFIFTRAIDRRAYLSMKYFFGVPVLLAFAAFCSAIEGLNLRAAFWNLISEPLVRDGTTPGAPVEMETVVLGIAAAILLFSILFLLVSTTASGSSFLSQNLVGVILFGGYVWLVFFFLSARIGGAARGEGFPAGPGSHLPVALAALLVPAMLLYFLSREVYARRELPPLVARNGRSSAFPWVGIVLLILAVLAVLMVLFLTVSHEPVIGG